MRIMIAAAAALVACVGCNQGSDIQELKEGQKQVLARLDSIDKSVTALKNAPAARPAAAPNAPDPNKVYDIPVGSSPVRGPKNAKVTIVEFSDFQCPFCAQSAPLVDQVLEQYPNDVNFVYKQFPLTSIHPFAMGASKASLAAGKQGKYWEMHDLLFKNNRALSTDNLKDYAKQLGLNVEQFEKDMNSPDVQTQIEQEMKEASAAEVRGTPTFFVDGKRLMNRSLEGFKQMIDEAKAKG
jgi:protein-disulfide isomerase